MARTIESPGVEIREIDLSFNTELPVGTTSLVLGYTKEGPTDELVNVTSREELELIYGNPETAAERYSYHTAKEILNANGNLLFTRLPYGSGDGEGYTTAYSALVYPYIPVDTVNSCSPEVYPGLIPSYTSPGVSLGDTLTDATEGTVSKFSLYDLTSAICVSEQTDFEVELSYLVGDSQTFISVAPADTVQDCYNTLNNCASALSANTDPVFWLSGVPAASAQVLELDGWVLDGTTITSSFVSGTSAWGYGFSVSATDTNANDQVVTGTATFDTSGSVIPLSTVGMFANYGELSGGFAYGTFTDVAQASADSVQDSLAQGQCFTATVSTDIATQFLSASFTADVVLQDAITGQDSFQANEASHYYIGEPVHIAIDDDTYFQWLQGGINWDPNVRLNELSALYQGDNEDILRNVGQAAMIIVNENKTTIGDNFNGTYIAISDNSKIDKGSNFDSVRTVKSFNDSSSEHEWVTLNDSALAFGVTGSFFEKGGSVSEIVENIPNWDFSNTGPGGFGDSLIVGVFKLRPSIYNDEERILDRTLFEAHIGSLDSTRMLQNQGGGSQQTFFLENTINETSNGLKCFVNPWISTRSGTWYDTNTQEPKKFVRVISPERSQLGGDSSEIIGQTPAEPHNTAEIIFNQINPLLGNYLVPGDNLYGIGEYMPCDPQREKAIGNLPRKLERALRLAENYELIRLDLVPEAGLGTVWTGMNLDLNNYVAGNAATNRNSPKLTEIYDENTFISGILEAHPFDQDNDYGLRDPKKGSSAEAQDLWESVATVFNQFCQFTRKDCLQIADPLRHIFVQGSGEVKVMDNKKLNFSQHMFWPLKNLFGALNSSYACTYANWFKINDTIADRFVWVPPSGQAARLMVQTDTNFFPWYAPAGLTRGVQSGILDIAINPSQKQRDLLYKNGLNPTVYWPGDGYVVWGQKTLQNKPSAFDRINVRRLFLWAEKAVLQIARYFVFEQNTPFTRARLKTAIDPVLAFAKSNEGIFDYLIVCDDRNNPPEVIDRNELVVDIYIKPVRVAEYILINFIATRTGQRFDELV
jgi:hypothetical protein